jgi:hypothetical protein
MDVERFPFQGTPNVSVATNDVASREFIKRAVLASHFSPRSNDTRRFHIRTYVNG